MRMVSDRRTLLVPPLNYTITLRVFIIPLKPNERNFLSFTFLCTTERSLETVDEGPLVFNRLNKDIRLKGSPVLILFIFLLKKNR